MRARIVIAVAVLIVASAGFIVYLTWPSSAANPIFVAITGNDSASGAETSPLRTIKAAVARATDTVVMLPNPSQWYQVSVSYRATATGNMLPLSVFTNNLTAGSGELAIDDCSLTTREG